VNTSGAFLLPGGPSAKPSSPADQRGRAVPLSPRCAASGCRDTPCVPARLAYSGTSITIR